MATLFGKQLTRSQLAKYTGHLLQAAGVRMLELKDGREEGLRIADVRTGSGLRFQVSLDRGMDISGAEYKGIPLAWRSPAGDVHPKYFEPAGYGWLRSFPGGLMTGCGLSQAGAPCIDDGEELGLHGRLSHLPAFDVRSTSSWKDDRCFLSVEGFVREYTVFGRNLSLHRQIETELGSSRIVIRDQVLNESSASSPIMMLYHINLGWPLISPSAKLLLNAAQEEPRDEEARKGVREARVFSEPVGGFKEQVFYYKLHPDKDGFGIAVLHNPDLDLGLYVRFRMEELPQLAEWKMMGEGTYVVGLEPANCYTSGRAAERKRGTLQFLEPGESREFEVQVGILKGDEIQKTISEQKLR